MAAHPGGALAIVAHGGNEPRAPLPGTRASRPSAILALGQDYAALSVLVWSRGRFTLARLNHQVALTGRQRLSGSREVCARRSATLTHAQDVASERRFLSPIV